MRNIDLHMHSTYSDGTYTPSQLVNYAKQKGLSALSLTDHDTIDGLDKAKRQSDLLNIQFINGVEINSFYYLNNRKINIHVLGYAFVPQKLEPYMAMLKTLKPRNNEIYLTDAFDVLATEGKLLASTFEGVRYDVGDKLGYIKANVEYALRSKEIGADTADFIKELAKTL